MENARTWHELGISLANLAVHQVFARPSGPGQVVPLYLAPLCASFNGMEVICGSRSLPFRDGACDVVRLAGTLALVIDEIRLLEECFRILRPGGTLCGHAPNARGLGHLDLVNLARYFMDVTRKSPPLSELREAGWRKHYAHEDLRHVLDVSGFAEITVRPVKWRRGTIKNLKLWEQFDASLWFEASRP